MSDYKDIVRQLKLKYGVDYINKCSSVELFYLKQARDFERDTPEPVSEVYF